MDLSVYTDSVTTSIAEDDRLITGIAYRDVQIRGIVVAIAVDEVIVKSNITDAVTVIRTSQSIQSGLHFTLGIHIVQQHITHQPIGEVVSRGRM